MKLKLRFSGRGGQGIKFLGTALVRVAMLGKYYATLSVDYTPSVRGGPIFCDVVLSSDPISYPFCDKDADVFIAIDQKGFDRASECIWENTVSFVDTNTVENPEEIIKEGTIYRVPISRRADENNVPKATNILSLGFISQYLHDSGKIDLKEEHYDQVFNRMPERFRDVNLRSFQLGKMLYQEIVEDTL
ncbi:MAG: 2-oxoacid:acceptor oxidoreductase family protein [Promethearchaeota archaeon]|jgi:2-oxoglutarate ferredoxin oxidoreductase subunit gamma